MLTPGQASLALESPVHTACRFHSITLSPLSLLGLYFAFMMNALSP